MTSQAVITAVSNMKNQSVVKSLFATDDANGIGFLCLPGETVTTPLNGPVDITFIVTASDKKYVGAPVKKMVFGNKNRSNVNGRTTYTVNMEIKTSMINGAHHM
jgi:hypothetical protein